MIVGPHPIEWSVARLATEKPSPYIGEVLTAAFSKAQAVVVLMTPDDEAWLRTEYRSDHEPPHEVTLTPQARPNVLFEAGMAMAWDQNRTVLVELGTLRPFSDVIGRYVVHMDDRIQSRQELAQRLKTAGCPVSLSGMDWHTTGEFDASLRGALGAMGALPGSSQVDLKEVRPARTEVSSPKTPESRQVGLNFEGKLSFTAILAKCAELGDQIEVGHTGGIGDLRKRELAYLHAKQWKWRYPTTAGPIVKQNWISGVRFRELVLARS